MILTTKKSLLLFTKSMKFIKSFQGEWDCSGRDSRGVFQLLHRRLSIAQGCWTVAVGQFSYRVCGKVSSLSLAVTSACIW